MSQTAGEWLLLPQEELTELGPSGCRRGERIDRQVECWKLLCRRLGRKVSDLENSCALRSNCSVCSTDGLTNEALEGLAKYNTEKGEFKPFVADGDVF
jgi:hypothetical protein